MARKSRSLKGVSRDEMLRKMRAGIIDGQIPPGTKLVECDLMDEYGVGRSVVRSVFYALEIEGLVEKRPNKGVTVRSFDFDTLLEIMEIRQSLESMAAYLAAQRTKPEDWKDLYIEFGKPLDDSIEQLDFETYFQMISAFRSRLLSAAKNEELSKLVNSLFAKIQIVQRRIIILPGRIKEAITEHRAILKALMEGDAAEAERLKRLNLQSATECLKKYKKWVF
jgi:DNA-binding GntR family transcriptional regulator